MLHSGGSVEGRGRASSAQILGQQKPLNTFPQAFGSINKVFGGGLSNGNFNGLQGGPDKKGAKETADNMDHTR